MSEQEKVLKPKIEKESLAPTSPEQVEMPIKSAEKTDSHFTEQTSESVATDASAPVSATPLAPEVERAAEIERILEDDLATTYFNLPEDKKEEFRVQGEKTAWAINQLLSATKVKVKKIISLIRNWLLIIPGVNKFFLEQEAKIKADKIIKLKDKI